MKKDMQPLLSPRILCVWASQNHWVTSSDRWRLPLGVCVSRVWQRSAPWRTKPVPADMKRTGEPIGDELSSAFLSLKFLVLWPHGQQHCILSKWALYPTLWENHREDWFSIFLKPHWRIWVWAAGSSCWRGRLHLTCVFLKNQILFDHVWIITFIYVIFRSFLFTWP